MSTWTPAELDLVDTTEEVRVAGLREDGSLRTAITIWAVRVDDTVYIRSVLGAGAGWYRGTQLRGLGHLEAGALAKNVSFTRDPTKDARVDEAYWTKYGRGPDVIAINSELATSTTLRVDPLG